MTDQEWMLQAIRLGEQGRYGAPPNPWVGCVIVRDGKFIAEGYHAKYGGPHAEVVALDQVRDPIGTTVYVTLEPCSHEGKTHPCVDRLIRDKVGRVFVALEDPDPKVSGGGISRLRAEGIPVEVGLCAKEAEASLLPYLNHRRTGRPLCIVKIASSLDGKIAAADGSSQWITCKEAREDVQRLRMESQAIAVGSGTAICDQPRLTVRIPTPPEYKPPLRVLFDTHGKVPQEGPLFDQNLAPTLIYSAKNYPEIPLKEGYLCLKTCLEDLGNRGVLQLLVEGGAGLVGALFEQDLVGQLILYLGPCALGNHGKSWFTPPWPQSIGSVPRWSLIDLKRYGDTACMTYALHNNFF